MDVLAALYPPLPERKPLPAYYTPICFLLCILPFLTENKRLASISTFPILLFLCTSWPHFTTGDPSSGYYNNSYFVAIPLWYLDFVFLTPRDGEGAPAFIGPQSVDDKHVSATYVQYWKDQTTLSQRAKWAFRLMLPAHRGVGWNWQVKGVPADLMVKLPKWQYVRQQILWTVFYYVQSVVALFTLALGYGLRTRLEAPGHAMKVVTVNAVVGWSGAVWVWDRLTCAYSLAAALGVATGLTAKCEWPPLMGPLKDAWSVRQMWSSTYHQVCRRLLSQPSKRIAGLSGLRKGSIASSYSQLFISFGISCHFHQAQMFNVTRRDMGELAFFMSQPMAIVAEDLMHWAWKKFRRPGKTTNLEKLIGYCWTIAWFSLSLQWYISGLVEAQVMKDWVFSYTPLELGANAGQQLQTWLSNRGFI